MRFSRPKRKEYEHVVQDNLAVTPSQMMELTQKGIPVSTQNLGMAYQDGVSALGYEPPLEYQRGIDMNDCWNAEMRGKEKIKKLKKLSKTPKTE